MACTGRAGPLWGDQGQKRQPKMRWRKATCEARGWERRFSLKPSRGRSDCNILQGEGEGAVEGESRFPWKLCIWCQNKWGTGHSFVVFRGNSAAAITTCFYREGRERAAGVQRRPRERPQGSLLMSGIDSPQSVRQVVENETQVSQNKGCDRTILLNGDG